MQDQENQAVPPNPEAAAAAASAQPSTPEAGLSSLEQQLADTEAKLAEMHDAFMRAKADGENIRRRAQEDVSKAHKFAVESFAEALVPVKDSLEMALKVEAPTLESLKEGVEMTLKQLSAAFERNRLIAIEPAQGEKLDPNKHQAVAVVPADQEANTVVSVLQKGYMIADRLLRPAIVTAAQAK
ncbi:nucleotide exchange factor GrpE [Pseudoduganella sp. FT26W]|jgi:molecular chaperone GrpE|uniref:Protein GrpE n=2 Tax=Duganella TaxID=75654 RepID=A0A6L5QFU0_9BURK|nr:MULTISPECIES: nucleotide exchange factor GrpE [Duganella]MRW86103.1 nucleotide exchange factor GrpE [Duganella aquatilis]MRX08480.1 nucleotide exchange factor GrpE [Duganella alba]MRX17046.1 nucleotide exchange factor GrpE [Duganella alba]